MPQEEQQVGYDPAGEVPLGAYTALTSFFVAMVAGVWVLLAKAGRHPQRPSPLLAVRIGVATHKLARIIAKDKVTAPYRAPFTRVRADHPSAPAELDEVARGTGLRFAIGQLLICPYCLAPWLASLLIYGRALAPDETDNLIGMLEAVTVADFLQVVYRGSERQLLGSP